MNSEVHVFRQEALIVADFLDIQLANGNAHNITAHIKHRAAGITFVHLGRDLKRARIVSQAGTF